MAPTSSGLDPESPSSRGTFFFHPFSFLLGALIVVALWGAVELFFQRPEPAAIALIPPPTSTPSPTPSPTPTPAPITVFVSGAVRSPGLYTLAPDARVGDAIASAGGVLVPSSADAVNQAELLWDGAQIHIPALLELTAGSQNLTPIAGVSGALPTPTPPPGVAGGGSGLVNVNTASVSELETLPGIGPSKAAAIIANRPYATVEDLGRVPGIGDKTVEQLRPYVATQ